MLYVYFIANTSTSVGVNVSSPGYAYIGISILTFKLTSFETTYTGKINKFNTITFQFVDIDGVTPYQSDQFTVVCDNVAYQSDAAGRFSYLPVANSFYFYKYF